MTQTTETRAFVIKNMADQDVAVLQEPWTTDLELPAYTQNREAYRKWMSDPSTDHVFYSLVEGEIPSLKVTSTNKPRRVHGVVADYDNTGLSDEEIRNGLLRANATGYPPYAWHRTRSGSVRLVWLFEEPIWYYDARIYKKVVTKLKRELQLAALFPGLDETALLRAEQYYASKGAWGVTGKRIRAEIVTLWLLDTTKNDDFDGGVEVPLDVVAAEMERQFPGRWTGEVRMGARGVRFWDPSADALAAVIRPSGVQCFTGDRPFMSWGDIFGRAFIEKYQADRTGAAIRDTWYDGQHYFRRLPSDQWDSMSSAVVRRHFNVQYGLSVSAGQENQSEVDLAMHRVEITKRIGGAIPFPHNPRDVVEWNGQRYLNTSNTPLWPAALDPQEWGVGFPWIANYLSTLFKTDDGLRVFLAWAGVWLKSCHSGSPVRGQALFIVGPTGTGKTLLSRVILGKLVGGYADVAPFFVGDSKYNSSIFNKALWCVDDGSPMADKRSHARFSNLVKASVANDSFTYEEKYGYAGAVPFSGRLIVTLNDDPISMGILPDTDASLLDKVIMLETGDIPADVAEDEKERYAVIERELGAFVRWLLDWDIPEVVERDTRFGIKAWHEENVIEQARAGSDSATIGSMLDMWIENYRAGNPDATEWRGTTSELFAHLHNYELTKPLISRSSPVVLGRQINKMISMGEPGIRTGRSGKNRHKIIVISL